MAEPQPGSKVAKELGIYLGQIYSYVKKGTVVNHKEGGYPEGKGIEVDIEEVRAAMSKGRGPRGSRTPKEPKLDADGQPKQKRMKRSREVDHPTRSFKKLSPACPVDEDHGALLPNDSVEGKKNGKIWMCTHQAHDGRSRHHNAGEEPPTQFTFTEEEAHLPPTVGLFGRLMLNLITNQRLDVAEELEKLAEWADIPVWIPAR
jgi:hypothetical protein